MTVLEVNVTNEKSNMVELTIRLLNFNRDECEDLLSECKLFSNTITCQFLVTFPMAKDGKNQMIFMKSKNDDGVIKPYTSEFYYYGTRNRIRQNGVINTNCNKWQLIGEKECGAQVLYLILIPGKCVPFKELYDDTVLTDFKLYGESDDAGVSFHRNVLAFSSPVLKSMLLGGWKETRQGNVQLPFISTNTLKHFKEYIYLNNIPGLPVDCAKLLCLASYYMLNQLPKLENDVAAKLESVLKPAIFWPWFEFCIEHKNSRMLVMWLKTNPFTCGFEYNFSDGPYEKVFKLKPKCTFSKYYNLYDDKDFIDFEIRTGDNTMYSSVDVHRNVMASFSPVLQALFQNEWKNAKYGYIQPNDVSKLTLQHFKDFIYLQRVPDDSTDCAKLITLAAYYKIPELEKEAALKIADNLKPENIWQWFEYCVEQKHDYLLVAMFKNIYEHNKIDSIKDCLSKI